MGTSPVCEVAQAMVLVNVCDLLCELRNEWGFTRYSVVTMRTAQLLTHTVGSGYKQLKAFPGPILRYPRMISSIVWVT